MAKPKIRPPSQVDALSFPVFGLTWHGAPSNPKGDGCSLIAYCGGGGSAKTGVGNKIIVTYIRCQKMTIAVHLPTTTWLRRPPPPLQHLQPDKSKSPPERPYALAFTRFDRTKIR
mmetsp:Transcript_35081/g.74028  ORF Transcript_35081/g.74028 Transcript_35081/m.74028 type:complete len:115 (+) Transcript_35081:147-491(+)